MSDATPIAADNLPEGEFAIVEIVGHRTLVGRYEEIDRFGTKMLQVEAFFGDVMLPGVLVGGSSIYQFTPCTSAVAYARRPLRAYQLPPSVLATVPAAALPAPEPSFMVVGDDDDEAEAFGGGVEP